MPVGQKCTPSQPDRHLWGRFSGVFHFLLLCSPAESQPRASWIGLYGCHTNTIVLLNSLSELGSKLFNSAYGFILKAHSIGMWLYSCGTCVFSCLLSGDWRLISVRQLLLSAYFVVNCAWQALSLCYSMVLYLRQNLGCLRAVLRGVCIALKICLRPSSFEREERERRRHVIPVFWEKRNVVLTRPPTRFL